MKDHPAYSSLIGTAAGTAAPSVAIPCRKYGAAAVSLRLGLKSEPDIELSVAGANDLIRLLEKAVADASAGLFQPAPERPVPDWRDIRG